MDILAIILACSLHPDDELVRTLIDIESSGNIYFVGDLATLNTNDSLKSAETALRFAEDLRRHGGRPALGLLGVPIEWAARYGRAPIELFDACTNISIATAALADYRLRCTARLVRHGHRHPPHTASSPSLRYCIVSRYARAMGLATAPAATLKRLIAERGVPPADVSDSPAERSSVLWEVGEAAPSSSASPSRPRVFLDEPPPATRSH